MIRHVYGHRGARGLYPENTIDGFLRTLNLPIRGFELDLVVSKDKQLIISHEPWMNHQICSAANGAPISEATGKEINIYRSNYHDICKFDCGSKGNPLFPSQQSFYAVKPTLQELINALNKSCDTPLELLFEIKSNPKWYGHYQPEPDEYASQIIRYIDKLDLNTMPILMSFDPNILNAIKNISSQYKIGFLINNTNSIEENLIHLNFKPELYNLEHSMVTKTIIENLMERDMQIIPWTVNTLDAAKRLSKIGVTSIISDYPDLFL